MGRISQASYAFDVDPRRKERYSLRQSRYDALAQDVSDLAGDAARAGDRLRLLIVGCAGGSELRHLRGKPHFDQIIVSGANLDDKNFVDVEQYTEVFIGDIRMGYPEIDSDRYDVVICEQVLEHLDRLDVPIATLERVLQPGGKLIVGVPIFPPPFHLVRRHVVPIVDALLSRRKTRGHVQAFSLSSFIAEMKQYSGLKLREVRGFRIVSGGPLRRLENYRWWWKFNRRLGDFMPAACIEIQAIMEKPRNSPQPNRGTVEIAVGLDHHVSETNADAELDPGLGRRPALRSTMPF